MITELDPSSRFGPESLALADLKAGRYPEAIAGLQKAVELSGRSSRALAEIGYVYAVSGRRYDALQVLTELNRNYAKNETVGQNLSAVYCGFARQRPGVRLAGKGFSNACWTIAGDYLVVLCAPTHATRTSCGAWDSRITP